MCNIFNLFVCNDGIKEDREVEGYVGTKWPVKLYSSIFPQSYNLKKYVAICSWKIALFFSPVQTN